MLRNPSLRLVHLTETCEAELPHLITHVETTESTTQDMSTTDSIHEALAEKELLPNQHLVDQGYTSAHLLVTSGKEHGIDLVGPVAIDQHWQSKTADGFSRSDFKVNWNTKKVRCPQGKYSRVWKRGFDSYGKPVIHVEFRHRHCSACPVRSQCTKSKVNPRSLTFKLREDYEALEKARERQQSEEFKELYATRAGVEGTISQGVRRFEIRQCRYIGLAKTRLQHLISAAAMNVVRAVSWLEGVPFAQTRQSRFAKLAPVA
jgi:transposase